MVKRPEGMTAFEFAVLSGLRAAQLQRGCTPRVPPAEKIAVTAQLELAEQKIARCADAAGFGILEPSHELVRADDRP